VSRDRALEEGPVVTACPVGDPLQEPHALREPERPLEVTDGRAQRLRFGARHQIAHVALLVGEVGVGVVVQVAGRLLREVGVGSCRRRTELGERYARRCQRAHHVLVLGGELGHGRGIVGRPLMIGHR
jgi:hypothetical protein